MYPHLPPQSCSLKAHNHLRLLPWAVFIVLISALSSVAAALAIISWFLPGVLPDAGYFTRGANDLVANRVVLDPILNRKIKQSLLKIYDTREKIKDSFYYKESAYVGRAALLSSDGWAVIGETEKINSQKYWEAVDAQGTVYPIKKFVADPIAGLTYFKIEGEGFRVMAFYDWNGEEKEGETLWSLGKDEWREIFLGEWKRINGNDVFPIWRPQYARELLPSAVLGSIVLNTQGELAGLVGEEDVLTPGWLIENQLPGLLARGQIIYSGLPYQGYIVESESVSGFYVAASPRQSSSSTIGMGDVIVKINNRPFDEADLGRQILLAPSPIAVTVLREGEESDIMVEKTKVN